MSGPNDDDQDWQPSGKTMDLDGRVSGGPDEAKPSATVHPPRPPPPAREEELKLDERAPKQPDPTFEPSPVYREVQPTPKRGGVSGWLWAVAVLLLAAGGAVMFWPAVGRQVPADRRGAPLLQVTSTPEGATVKLNGNAIGETPVFVENLYGGEIAVTVSKRGYGTWTGTAKGGEPVTLEVELSRQR